MQATGMQQISLYGGFLNDEYSCLWQREYAVLAEQQQAHG